MTKVSVQEAVALDGHFATLCQEVDFNFKKEKAKTFVLSIILIVNSLQIAD